MNPTAEILSSLIDHAITEHRSTEQPGFIQVMAKKDSRSIQNDIPAAFEMYALLQHYLGHLPLRDTALSEDLPEIDLTPGILYDGEHKRVVALIACETDTLPYIAHYVADRIPSSELKGRAGTLALSFTIETHGEVEHLIPEWHAAWYVGHDPGHCIPVLTLRSVLQDEQFSGDWVDVAMQRMGVFRLPRAKALEALQPRTQTN